MELDSDATLASPLHRSAPVLVRRIAQLFVGLFLYGVGIALMVRAELGVAPWDVLTQGIAKQTGLASASSPGPAARAAALDPDPAEAGLRHGDQRAARRPRADLVLWLDPARGPTSGCASCCSRPASLVLGVATGLYIGARLGPGPRDGLMTGPAPAPAGAIWIVRTLIEVTVLAIGWLLGGNVGIGTVAFALLIGPICDVHAPAASRSAVPRPDARRSVRRPCEADRAHRSSVEAVGRDRHRRTGRRPP